MAQSAQKQRKCKIHLSSYNTWGIQLWSKPKVSEDRLIDCYATFEGHDFWPFSIQRPFFKAKPKLKGYTTFKQMLLKQNKVFWEIENDHI